ncbi:DUF317 domain-containing protein [Streptomyces sp. NPDC094049]|uniref:DUF317 domain-containing protein n=1 Tax=Streptomyces sp. NPDC094049 TaxID=3154987 RepID=UPI0033209B73
MSTWTTARALDHVEASLYPQHSSDSRLPEPPYWVAPRHLAGDDDALADQVGAALAAAGWRMWPTARDTLLYTSPNGLCGAEWMRAACSFERGDLPVAWQISARSHPDSGLPEWNAYLTAGVPHEALTDFLLALDAHTEPALLRRPRGCPGGGLRPGLGPLPAESVRTGVRQDSGWLETSGGFREIQPQEAASDRIQPDRSSQQGRPSPTPYLYLETDPDQQKDPPEGGSRAVRPRQDSNLRPSA